MNKTTFEIEASLPTTEQAALMSNAALGCYVKLMCSAWREGSIPNDIQRIARLCGEPPQAMTQIWEQIQDCFIDDMIRPGRLIHVGLERQRVAAQAVSSAKSKAGSIGAARRWAGKRGPADDGATRSPAVESRAPAPAAAQPPAAQPASSPTPDPRQVQLVCEAEGSIPQADLFSGVPGEAESQIQPPKAEGVPPCPQVQVIELYHRLLPAAPKVLTWGDTREALMRQRWREMATTTNADLGNGYKNQADGLEWWSRYFSYVAKSPFLTGRAPGRDGAAPFIATLEWLIRPKNFAKVLEGQYHRT